MKKTNQFSNGLNALRAMPSTDDTVDTGPVNFKFEIIRSFPDDQCLFMHMIQYPEPGVHWVTMSLISLDPEGSGRIVHQVTNRQVPRANPDASRVDGTRYVNLQADVHQTRSVVSGFVSSVLLAGMPEACGDWVDPERFITHNPYMKPDLSGFQEFLSSELTRPDPLRYICVSDIAAYCDFAAVFSVIDFRGEEYRACDLFRVEGGKIVEHWDIAERADNQIPPGNDRSFMPL